MEDLEATNSHPPKRGFQPWHIWIPALLLGSLLSCVGICVAISAVAFGRYAGPTYASPDGRYQAQVYGSNCGATCPFGAWVVVTDRHWSWLPWPLPLNVSPLWPDIKETVYDSEYHPCSIVPVWDGDRALTIVEPDPANQERGKKRDSEWDGVQIQYTSNRTIEDQVRNEDCYERGSRRYLWQGLQGLGTIAMVMLVTTAGLHLVLRRLSHFSDE